MRKHHNTPVKIMFLLVVFSLLLGCTPANTTVSPTSAKSTLVPTSLPTSTDDYLPNSTLFLVDNIGRLEYRFTLYDLETEKLNSENADFSITNWDVTLGSSRLDTDNGSEAIHYNPVTNEIIFLLFPIGEGIAGWKSPEALPNPPFRFAIYKTSFESQNQFMPLYTETALEFFVVHTVLNSQINSLFMDVNLYNQTYNEVPQPEILKFDITTKQFERITNPETEIAGKDLVERSDLRLSSDGQKLYQLVLYGDPRYWTDETLYLMTINLQDKSVNYQEIVTGGNIQYNILAISADSNRVAYYTLDTDQYHLWVKDLRSENVKSIPLPGDIGNFNLFMTNDGQEILVGFQERAQENIRHYWHIYDLNSNEYQVTPLNRPLAWDASGRYLAGIKDDTYVIYDTEAQTELKLGLSLPADRNTQSVQWR